MAYDLDQTVVVVLLLTDGDDATGTMVVLLLTDSQVLHSMVEPEAVAACTVKVLVMVIDFVLVDCSVTSMVSVTGMIESLPESEILTFCMLIADSSGHQVVVLSISWVVTVLAGQLVTSGAHDVMVKVLVSVKTEVYVGLADEGSAFGTPVTVGVL